MTMMKNSKFYIRIAYALLAFVFVLLLSVGCEDPGPAGQSYIYANHVDVITLAAAPSMTNPNDEIWNQVPTTVLSFEKDPDEFIDDLSNRIVNISAIRHADRIYIKTLWKYDGSYDVKPEPASFSRDYTYPRVLTEVSFSAGSTHVDTLVTLPNDTLFYVNYALIQFENDSLPGKTHTGDSVHLTIIRCSPTGENDTVLETSSETSDVWNVIPEFACDSTDSIVFSNNKDEYWTRATSSILDTLAGIPTIDHIVDTIPPDTIWNFTYEYYNIGKDQDRLAIMWDMGNNGTEGGNCQSMCHDVGNESSMGHRMYTSQGGTVDVWHWQSALSNPVYLAVDEIWTDSGRTPDELTSPIFEINWDTANSRPLYMHNTDTQYTTLNYLLANETTPLTLDEDFWPQDFEIAGYTVSDNATGSGADISSFSWHSSRHVWYVLMSRALSTGNADDVDLSGLNAGDSIMTSIAIMDNSSSIHFIGDEPIYFIFR
ncbi:MAG: hypothetical protein KAR42_06660 [candidate division Zixibacteria bacterium]|nr:hypothetical protein [candidate division Zixibacteria bacterium]